MSAEEEKRQKWEKFIRLCEELKFGELEKVTIKNGVPVHAEIVKQSLKLD